METKHPSLVFPRQQKMPARSFVSQWPVHPTKHNDGASEPLFPWIAPMPDVFTKAKRSAVMSRIRGHGNKETEIALMKLLRRHHVTGWRSSWTAVLARLSEARD